MMYEEDDSVQANEMQHSENQLERMLLSVDLNIVSELHSQCRYRCSGSTVAHTGYSPGSTNVLGTRVQVSFGTT